MDEITAIDIAKDLGFPALAFLLIYVASKRQQDKTFEQFDRFQSFSETIVTLNTKALEHMNSTLEEHIKQKDTFIGVMGQCAEDRDERLRRIETQVEGMKTELHSGLYDLTKIAEQIMSKPER